MEQTARWLADSIGMPMERRDIMLARLREAIAHGKIAAFAKDQRISGIFAYQK